MTALPLWDPKPSEARGKRVLLRLDINVPQASVAQMKKSWRLQRSLEEVTRLQKLGAKVLILAHWGDPEGKKDPKLSLKKLVPVLKSMLGHTVLFAPEYGGKKNDHIFAQLEDGGVALAENLRFFAGEQKNDDRFASQIAHGADVYINNAFSVCHRKHASVFAITRHVQSFAGSLLVEEVTQLTRPIEHPFALVVGGAKISTKLPLLERLGSVADKILIAGGPATSTLCVAQVPLPAYPKQFTGEESLRSAGRIYRRFHKKIILPTDLIADTDAGIIYDHGPESRKNFAAAVKGVKTIIWNGPFGIIEKKTGKESTEHFAHAIAKQRKTRVIIGGGETVDLVLAAGLEKKMGYVSTGGGAMLAFLAGEPLPGLVALDRG